MPATGLSDRGLNLLERSFEVTQSFSRYKRIYWVHQNPIFALSLTHADDLYPPHSPEAHGCKFNIVEPLERVHANPAKRDKDYSRGFDVGWPKYSKNPP